MDGHPAFTVKVAAHALRAAMKRNTQGCQTNGPRAKSGPLRG